MKTFVLALLALSFLGCAKTPENEATPTPSTTPAPSSSSGMSSILLGGALGYLLGSSGNVNRSAPAPTPAPAVVEKHYYHSVPTPAPKPSTPAYTYRASPPSSYYAPRSSSPSVGRR